MPLHPDVYQGPPQHTFEEFRLAVLGQLIELVELAGRMPTTQFVSDGRNEITEPDSPHLTHLTQGDLYLVYRDEQRQLTEQMRNGANYFGAIYSAFAYQGWRYRFMDRLDDGRLVENRAWVRFGYNIDEPTQHKEWLELGYQAGLVPEVQACVMVMFEEALEDGYGKNVFTVVPLTYPEANGSHQPSGYGMPRVGYPRPTEYSYELGDDVSQLGLGTRIISERPWPPPGLTLSSS